MRIKLICIGLLTGFANGLFGSGGGTIVVPAMVLALGMEDKKAHATAISVILPLTLLSSYFYFRNNLVDWPLTLKVIAGGIPGGFIGARLLKICPDHLLRRIFGGFMILAAIRMVMG